MRVPGDGRLKLQELKFPREVELESYGEISPEAKKLIDEHEKQRAVNCRKGPPSKPDD